MCSSNLLELSSSHTPLLAVILGVCVTYLPLSCYVPASASGPGLIRCQTIKFVSFATYESVYFNMWAFYYAKTLPTVRVCVFV